MLRVPEISLSLPPTKAHLRVWLDFALTILAAETAPQCDHSLEISVIESACAVKKRSESALEASGGQNKRSIPELTSHGQRTPLHRS